MKKIIASLLIGSLYLFAEQVEITADKFTASETELTSVFTGNVKVVKGKDKLEAQKIVIYFDKNKQPQKYIATGNAKVNMSMKGKTYFGKGEKLTYEPVKLRYVIEKEGFLHEIETDKKVYGEKITVNQTEGTYEVDSDNTKPVKFIFQVDDKGIKN